MSDHYARVVYVNGQYVYIIHTTFHYPPIFFRTRLSHSHGDCQHQSYPVSVTFTPLATSASGLCRVLCTFSAVLTNVTSVAQVIFLPTPVGFCCCSQTVSTITTSFVRPFSEQFSTNFTHLFTCHKHLLPYYCPLFLTGITIRFCLTLYTVFLCLIL